jgi:hypothetical protein
MVKWNNLVISKEELLSDFMNVTIFGYDIMRNAKNRVEKVGNVDDI